MHLYYNALRLESEGVGVVIGAADHDMTLKALSTSSLIEQIFSLGGFSAKPSNSGLITRQLITRMGGVDATRAFKIPGVRKLLKTYAPNHSFNKSGALQIIRSTNSDKGSEFSDHKALFIEPRAHQSKLIQPWYLATLLKKVFLGLAST